MTRVVSTPERGGAIASVDDDVAVELTADRRLLVVRLRDEHALASWALVNGGHTRGRAVVWCYVDAREFGDGSDAEGMLRRALASVALPDAVGLLTARELDTYSDREQRYGDLRARCIATVGLGNALRAGDEPGIGLDADGSEAPAPATIGTINLLCRVSVPLTAEGLLEALSIATEARAAAVVDAGVPSGRSGRPATGTGTDCIVVAAPMGEGGLRYAGKHTPVGHLVGAAVIEAVREGIMRWRRDYP